ncbi:MAG TPA: BrnT family toxin [Terriglobia bacterium]|nr:BrnT family toxin [Terriglobia bacterium]
MDAGYEFEWDPINVRHIARHSVSPEEFEEAMRGGPFYLEVKDEGGEERYQALGHTKGLRVLSWPLLTVVIGYVL